MNDFNKMPDFIQAHHIDEILRFIDSPLAITDTIGQIIWCNQLFEKIAEKADIRFTLEDAQNNFDVEIKKLKTDFETVGYFIVANTGQLKQKEIRGLAHDFNNILSTITNSLEVLKQKIGNNADLLKIIGTIEKSKNRAIDITETLLPKKVTAVENKKKHDICGLTKELTEAITQTFPAGIKINLDLPAKLSPVLINTTEIYRCLLNICINAKEAMGSQGNINISVAEKSLSETDAEKLKLNQSDYIEIKISNSGPRIEAEILERIFEDGFSTKNKTRESGIGLNLVKKIIEKHGGKIFAESEMDADTVFTIYLPALSESEKQKRNGASKLILLVDDEIDLRELLAELLESHNFNVIQAGGGFEAMKIFKQNKDIDLLIIDRKMPELDGIELIKLIREQDKNIRIILASGSPLADNDSRVAGLEVDKILNKPYEFDQLFEIIEELFR